MESKSFATYEQRIIFEITILYIILVVGILLIPYQTDSKTIGSVPVAILQWAIIGGLTAVIYRLVYQRKRFANLMQLRTWVIARPIIGMVIGVLVYFLAYGVYILALGAFVLSKGIENAPPPLLVGSRLFFVLAFIAAFSDRWYRGLIDRGSFKPSPDEGDRAAGTQARED
jgi:sterol desaturase/sphingolipid hydroxylase (fatty acid hydroxylase superfamily)